MNRIESIKEIVISGSIVKIVREKEIEIVVMDRKERSYLEEFIKVFRLEEVVREV